METVYILCTSLCSCITFFLKTWNFQLYSLIQKSFFNLSVVIRFHFKGKTIYFRSSMADPKISWTKKTPQFAYKNVTWSWFPIEEETQIFTFLLWNSYMLFDRKSTSDRLYWPLNAVQSRFWSVLVDSPCSLRYICLFQD